MTPKRLSPTLVMVGIVFGLIVVGFAVSTLIASLPEPWATVLPIPACVLLGALAAPWAVAATVWCSGAPWPDRIYARTYGAARDALRRGGWKS